MLQHSLTDYLPFTEQKHVPDDTKRPSMEVVCGTQNNGFAFGNTLALISAPGSINMQVSMHHRY
jgi:hypothetical protein